MMCLYKISLKKTTIRKHLIDTLYARDSRRLRELLYLFKCHWMTSRAMYGPVDTLALTADQLYHVEAYMIVIDIRVETIA